MDFLFPTAPKKSHRKEPSWPCPRGQRREDGSLSPLAVSIGDHILYGKDSGSEIQLAGEEYWIVREEEVLGVLEGAEQPAARVA